MLCRNGDLSKPTGGLRGRHYIETKWKELTKRLNNEDKGNARSEPKWRKVWSDLKNNTKRKWAKINNRNPNGTSDVPGFSLSLTLIENKVMQIIGENAASSMPVEEAGFQQIEESLHKAQNAMPRSEENWNTSGTSNEPTGNILYTSQPSFSTQGPEDQASSSASAHSTDEEENNWQPPPPKKRKINQIAKLFVHADKVSREYSRERDMVYEKLETERLRLREYEFRERIRQRDQELQLQAKWLELMKEGLNAFVKYMENKRS